MLKQSASDGSICAENKQTLEVFLLSLFSFFSTDATQRYVMFGSSEAGHRCLWRLLADVSVTRWGSMHSCSSKAHRDRESLPEVRENLMLSKKVLSTSKHAHYIQHNGYCTKASRSSANTQRFLWVLFPIVSWRRTVGTAHCVFGRIPLLACVSGVDYVIQTF